ncbi:hypothetical protein U1Q18_034565 [Sarracenia purpurea var. burkii]
MAGDNSLTKDARNETPFWHLPLGERKSYSGTVKAGSEPRPISDTTDAITELSMTIEVAFVSDDDDAALDGHKTDSTAKKQPATAALNPAPWKTPSELEKICGG